MRRAAWAVRAAALATASAAAFAACRAAPGAEPFRRSVAYQFDYLYLSPIGDFFEPFLKDGVPFLRTRRLGSTSPAEFPRKKNEGTLRVFVVGGSVAQLFEEVELERMLARALPGRKFEIVDCAMTAYDSYRDLLTVREVLRYDPDLIVLMSGVNEGEQAGPPAVRGRWNFLKGLARGLASGRPVRAWSLMRPDWRAQAPPNAIAARFAGNVRSVLDEAGRRGVPVVLCALPWNAREMPPRGRLPLGDRAFFDAFASFERGEYARAAEFFREHLSFLSPEGIARNPGIAQSIAFGEFYLGRSLDLGGDPAAATPHYMASMDFQTPPMTRINALLRRIGSSTGHPVADLDKAFRDADPGETPGFDLFEDDVHWERFADPMVAAVVVSSLHEAAAGRARRVLAPAGDWDMSWFGENRTRLLRPAPTPAQSREKAWVVFTHRVWSNNLRFSGGIQDRIVAMLDLIYRLNPELALSVDGMKEWVAGRLARNIWDRDAAAHLDEWWPALLSHMGEQFIRRGMPGDAVRFFDRAIELAPGVAYARFRRAAALTYAGRRKEARAELALVERAAFDFPEIGYFIEADPPPMARTPSRARAGGAEPRRAGLHGGYGDARPGGAEPRRAGLHGGYGDARPGGAEPWRGGSPAVSAVVGVKGSPTRRAGLHGGYGDVQARAPEVGVLREEGAAVLDRRLTPSPLAPGEERAIRQSLAAFSRGDARAGFSLYRSVAAPARPEAVHRVDKFCASIAPACAPLDSARGKVFRLNENGIGLFAAGRIDEAQALFLAAADLDPGEADSFLNLAAVASQGGDRKAALRHYESALRLSSGTPVLVADILSSRASVLAEDGRRSEAAEDLQRALREAPESWARRAETAERLRSLK